MVELNQSRYYNDINSLIIIGIGSAQDIEDLVVILLMDIPEV